MLEHFFGSKTRVKLMQIFFQSPTTLFYGRELARLTDAQLNGIRRELSHLEKIGVIKPVDNLVGQTIERTKYYQLDANFLLFSELKALLFKAQLIEQREYIERLKLVGEIKLLVIAGFFTQDTQSPTDILLVGKIDLQKLDELIAEFEKFLGQSIRYTAMDEAELAERKELSDVFLYHIFETKHLELVNTLE